MHAVQASVPAHSQPLSLHLVAFRIDNQLYGLPLAAVERVLPMVELSPLPVAPSIVLGILNLHGRILPVLDIRRRFSLPERGYGPSAHLMVSRTAARTVVLPADEVVGVMAVDPTAVVQRALINPGIGQVAGVVQTSDGLLFIQDLDAFLSSAEEEQLTVALEDVGNAER